MAATARKTERMADRAGRAKAATPSDQNDRGVTIPTYEDIALLAYSYWESRGCPVGSPDEDWFRAELDISRRQQS